MALIDFTITHSQISAPFSNQRKATAGGEERGHGNCVPGLRVHGQKFWNSAPCAAQENVNEPRAVRPIAIVRYLHA